MLASSHSQLFSSHFHQDFFPGTDGRTLKSRYFVIVINPLAPSSFHLETLCLFCGHFNAEVIEKVRGARLVTPAAMNARYKAWLLYIVGQGKGIIWRPRCRYGGARSKIIQALDKQLRIGTRYGGLSFLQPIANSHIRDESTWRDWPAATPSAHQCSDQLCATKCSTKTVAAAAAAVCKVGCRFCRLLPVERQANFFVSTSITASKYFSYSSE